MLPQWKVLHYFKSSYLQKYIELVGVQTLEWFYTYGNSEIPQGSIPGPILLSLIHDIYWYINYFINSSRVMLNRSLMIVFTWIS